LFDSRGNLVGITTAISTVAANMAFAIAASEFWP
jgi:S1-C subfamily serine protease